MNKFVLLCCLLLTACTLQNDPPPTFVVTPKVARLVVETPAPTATATPTLTPTPTATDTPTPTLTPTFTPTPNPYAVRNTLGGARKLPRARVLNLHSPADLEISPALFGINYWAGRFGRSAREELPALDFTVMRWGGENYELSQLDWNALDRFILDARALDVEPLIQVPYSNHDPQFAAQMVRYVNVIKKYDVRFWSIGNEEDKNQRGGAKEKWINTWRSYRDAMKAVDPRILIFGPEYANAYDFTDPANDWLTPWLKVNGDAVDVISLHRYPFNGNQTNPTVLVGDALGTARRVRALRDYIQRVTGRDIPLAFTEMNLSDNWRNFGEGSSASFSAGLWLAETMGQMAEAGVAMVNIWSAHGNDSLGLVAERGTAKRPTYYALQLYANYGDRVVPSASRVGNVSAHAARDSRTGSVTIVLVNRGQQDLDFQLVLNSGAAPQQGNIYFDLNTRKRIPFSMPAQSMVSLTLDNTLAVTRTMLYSRAMFDAKQDPVYSTTTP
jgi:hypothetical protein